MSARPERLRVALGNYSDVCPLCGIQRLNAGFLRETCGEHYRKPGCFIVARAAPSPSADEPGETP